MSRDYGALGLQLTLCLVLSIVSDGFIQGFQLNKVKIQLTDTISSSLIRRNILHSETISNRPSSSLLAKQPAEPAFQEQEGEVEKPLQKSRAKYQTAVQKGSQRKPSEKDVRTSVTVNNDDEKVKDNVHQQDQNARQPSSHSSSQQPSGDFSKFLHKLQIALDEGKLRVFVKILKSLAMEGLANMNLGELILVLEGINVSELDSSMTSDIIWSLGKLNFVVQNVEHKNLLYALMNRFCEHEEMSPREVTTSLVRFLNNALETMLCASISVCVPIAFYRCPYHFDRICELHLASRANLN